MLNVNDVNQIYLGCQGENLARTIIIDVKPWLVAYPGGTVAIWHKRNGAEEATATGAVFDSEAGTITWQPTGTDTYVFGEGEAEIRLTVGNVIKKSRTIKTDVARAVTGTDGEALGSGWQDYLDAIQRAAGVAIIKDGQIKFAINEAGHLILSYTNGVPIPAEEGTETTEEDEIIWTDVDLGPVDVYTEAVEAGYPGTKEEWLLELGSVKENAQAATASAETAEESAIMAEAAKVAAQAAQASAEQHTESVIEDWLEEHIDPESGYVLDRSLSLQNAAAPADIAGNLEKNAQVQFDYSCGVFHLGETGSIQHSSAQILSRQNNIFTVDGADGSSNYFVISGTMARYGSDFNSATPNIQLLARHRYRLTVAPLSEITYSTNIRFCVYKIENSAAVNLIPGIDSTGSSKEFTTYQDTMVFVTCYVKTGTNPSNYKAAVILQDITAESESFNMSDLYDKKIEEGLHELKYWNNSQVIIYPLGNEWTNYTYTRNRNIHTINGENSYSSTIRFKFADSVYRCATENALNSAVNDVTLKGGHVYKFVFKVLAGSVTGNPTARYRTESNVDLIVLQDGVPSYITAMNNTNGKLYFYIPVGATFTNYTFSLAIYDLTETKEPLLDTFKAIEDRENILGNVVPYWGADYAFDARSGANSIKIIRHKTRILFDGANDYGYALRYRISDWIARTTTETNINKQEKTINFIYTHKYRLLIKHISGSYTGYMKFYVTNENNTAVINNNVDEYGNGTFEFTWGYANSKGMIYIQFPASYTADNLELQVILLDITDELHGDYEQKSKTEIKRIQASRWVKSESVPPVSILHFSDIHGNGTELNNIMKFYQQNNNIIDSIICTGDMAKASVSSDFTFWENTEGIENVMVAMGNHEYYTNSASDHTKYNISDQIQKWIGVYYENWNVIRPEGASWYYKDYDEAMVRLIVIDCNLTNSEGGSDQKEWLESILDDANENEYAVVIASHYVYGGGNSYNENISHPFTNVFSQGTESSITYDWSPTCYVDTVQDFIDDGGTFVCWITGHSHADYLRNIKIGNTIYTDQLNVAITAASPSHDYPLTLTTGDLPREQGTPTESAFNVVTIDTVNKLLKIVRIGSDTTTKMTKREMMCYDYIHRQLLN